MPEETTNPEKLPYPRPDFVHGIPVDEWEVVAAWTHETVLSINKQLGDEDLMTLENLSDEQWSDLVEHIVMCRRAGISSVKILEIIASHNQEVERFYCLYETTNETKYRAATE